MAKKKGKKKKKKAAGKKKAAKKMTAARGGTPSVNAADEDADEAIGRYIRATGRVISGLTNAINRLAVQRNRAPIADRPGLSEGISNLKDARSDLQDERLAFLAEQMTVNPPSRNDVRKIKALADRLDEMIANARTAKAILKAATKLAESLPS